MQRWQMSHAMRQKQPHAVLEHIMLAADVLLSRAPAAQDSPPNNNQAAWRCEGAWHHSPQRLLTRAYLLSLVGCGLRPQLNPVTLGPDVDGNAAHLLASSELLANARQHLGWRTDR